MDQDHLSELANQLGYGWPEDKEGQWRVMQLMATRAAHWRKEVEACQQGVMRERMYQHQARRYHASVKKINNLRRALREFMAYQTAWMREKLTEQESNE